MKLITYVIIIAICGRHGADSWLQEDMMMTRWSPPVYKLDDKALIEELWFPVPLDHFDSNEKGTFKFRYFSTKDHGSGNASILIYVGGEWSIRADTLAGGSVYDIAKSINARLIYTEHRFYGKSQPFNDTSTEHLEKYQGVHQAMADLALLVRSLKSENPSAKIILLGGSYAANMVTWFVQKYPGLVDGGVASSGPVLAVKEFWGYLQVVHNTILEEGGAECTSLLDEAVKEVRQEMKTDTGRKRIAETFKLCNTLDPKDTLDIEYFYTQIRDKFSAMCQRANPGDIASVCQRIKSDEFGTTPFEKLANISLRYSNFESNSGFFNDENMSLAEEMVENQNFKCNDIKYENYIQDLRDSDVNNNQRVWKYQQCSEFGYFQISPTTGTIFDGLITMQLYDEMCRKVFGEKYTPQYTSEAVNKTNSIYGGRKPVVKNLITVHGLQDPWSDLGVKEDLGPTSPTFLVPKASHCFDLYSDQPSDTEQMVETKKKIKNIVQQWAGSKTL